MPLTKRSSVMWRGNQSEKTQMNGAVNGAENGKVEGKGEVKTDDKLPTPAELKKAGECEVFDQESKPIKFRDLLEAQDGSRRRTLVVFIRHFFCGNCQEYTSVLSSQIPPSTLSTLSPQTSVLLIGCGIPHLISTYISQTQCPYPIYADPTAKLYKTFRMGRTLQMGSKTPQYMAHTSISKLTVRSIWQELRSGRNLLRGGDWSQVGGEFVFEADGGVEATEATWCRRMRNTRDHTEVSELKDVLGLNDEKRDVAEEKEGAEKPALKKRWSVTAATSGLGRRLSRSDGGKKRMSWHASAGKQADDDLVRAKSPSDKEAEQERQVLEQLKEDNEPDAKGGDDAFEKLTKNTNAPAEGSGQAVADQSTAIPNGPALEQKTNGRAVEPAPQSNFAEPEQKLNGNTVEPASVPAVNGSTPEDELNGQANGAFNGTALDRKTDKTGLWSKIDKTANDAAINGSALNGSANGHITA